MVAHTKLIKYRKGQAWILCGLVRGVVIPIMAGNFLNNHTVITSVWVGYVGGYSNNVGLFGSN